MKIFVTLVFLILSVSLTLAGGFRNYYGKKPISPQDRSYDSLDQYNAEQTRYKDETTLRTLLDSYYKMKAVYISNPNDLELKEALDNLEKKIIELGGKP